ncbi:hypothetical protein EXIGLDRAFT_699681 [Exidia glandulosa HHB12029]|uniref:Uncharacterized protein n=1 Tax=Exidia glandulosa HHB12029 TaxID=1314781 RepID=A0A165DSB8_EXIGL|nr:hypothetical protein EXIGLDRAFT_699681 [Exidia glandulosa HHB12029]
MLEMLGSCPTCAGVRTLMLVCDDDDSVNPNEDPPWSRLMRPFPNAVNILPYLVSWDEELPLERGSAWAKAIAETCKNAAVIIFSPVVGFTRPNNGPDSKWESDKNALKAIADPLDVCIVYAVPR